MQDNDDNDHVEQAATKVARVWSTPVLEVAPLSATANGGGGPSDVDLVPNIS